MAAACVLLLCLGSAVRADIPPTEAQQRAMLDLIVNETAAGQVYALIRGADVLVPVEALERAGLRGVAGRREVAGGQIFVLLSSLQPDITFRVDERALTLRITAAAHLFGVTRLDLAGSERPRFTYSRATSAFLNYGADWRQLGGYSATTEAGLSVRGALATTTMTWEEGRGLTRGLSSVTIDDRVHLRRVVVGDSFAGDRLLGASLLLGGVRIAREYAIDPYFVQFPMLGLAGAATTPSTVEVYVDGRLVRQERVQPGRFELANVPVPSGGSRTRLVIRDAFGREQELRKPYYLTNAVLARGLHEYEYSLGFPRTDTRRSHAYGPLSLLVRHRYGVTNALTAGVRAEARDGLFSAGPGVNFRAPFGEIEVAGAASREAGRTGGAMALGYSWTGQPVNVGLSARARSRHYATLAGRTALESKRLELNAFMGVRVGSRSSLTLQHERAASQAAARQSQTSVFGTIRLGRYTQIFTSVSRSFAEGRRGHGFALGVSIPLGDRTGASVSLTGERGETAANVELQRAVPPGSGYGYRVRAAGGDTPALGARLQYHGAYGRYEAGHETVGSSRAASFALSGGLVAIGGTLHPTRPVQEGFALLRVPGVAGVRGFLSNQEVGRTNRHGDLLVPNLLPYYANRVSIADEDVPLTHEIPTREQSIAPPLRGGAVVLFGAEAVHSVVGRVVWESDGGTIVPEFGDIDIVTRDGPRSSPIGRGGRFYLEDLEEGHYDLTVRYRGQTCTFSLDVPAATSPVIDLGTAHCVARERKQP